MRGRLIAIEGTDCSGKETQANLLVKKLQAMGLKAIQVGFPMYDTPTGRIVGGPFQGNTNICESWFPEGPTKVDPKISCLFYATDRKYNFPRIQKYLEDGYYVILDRYVSSNMAHQGSKIENKDERFYFYRWIDKLEYWLLELPKADITFYLHMPYRFTKELMQKREESDECEKDDNYLIRSEETYIELSELYHWNTISCVENEKIRSIEEINTEILKIVIE